jgi:hypothetical protein
MKIIAFLLGLFITAMGALGTASPPMLLSMVRKFASPAGVYAATVLRLVMGSALHLSAPSSRIPGIVRALGDIIFATGAITPFFGLERIGKLLAWWSARGVVFIRAWSIFAVVFGLFLAWSVAPARPRRISEASRPSSG